MPSDHAAAHADYRWNITEPLSERTLTQFIAENSVMVYDGNPAQAILLSQQVSVNDVSAAGFPTDRIGRVNGPHSLILDLTSAGDASYCVHLGHSVDESLTTAKTKMLFWDGSTSQSVFTSADGHIQLLNPLSQFSSGAISTDVMRHAYYLLEVASAGTTSGEILWEFFSN